MCEYISENMNDLINLNHKITYNDPTLSTKFNITDEKEQQQLHDVIYKYDLINIFGLHDFLEEIIIEKINKLYSVMITDADIKKICSTLQRNIDMNNEDNYNCFMVLFSYDYLHLFYPCICEFINKGNISNETKNVLLKNIE
jgi:hypothetical protein